MNRKKIMYILLSFSLLTAAIFTGRTIYEKNHFNCTAFTEVNYKSQKMNIVSHYIFDGDIGSLVVEGEITLKDGVVYPFIIKNIFKFKRSDDTFYLTSLEIVTQPVNLEKTGYINEYLSQFFYKKQKSIVFEFSPQQSEAYVVYLGAFPVGFCKE